MPDTVQRLRGNSNAVNLGLVPRIFMVAGISTERGFPLHRHSRDFTI
jgi:hypothetical protein